jgi:Dolichyl-phosphate-mannose-protein mannosyltransferase
MFHLPTSRIPLLQDPPFALFLVLLGTALGWRLLRILRVPFKEKIEEKSAETSRIERGVLCAATGLGLLQYIAFGLGAIGHLTPSAVKGSLLVLTILLLPDMAHVCRALLHAVRQRRPRPSWPYVVGVLLIASVPLLQALCPCTDPDGMGYHLRAPKLWLQSGSLGYLPTMVHANSPMGVEMLYTLPLAVWSDTAAKLIHYALGLLSLLAVYALGRRCRNATVGAWAAATFALGVPGTPVLALSTYAYIDLGLTLQMVCAVLAWLRWHRSRHQGWLLCAALCAGFAFSFKLTGLLIVLTLAAVTFWESRQVNTLLVMGVGLLPGLPWLVRAWMLTGNPVYPFLAQVFPTRDWSAAHGMVFDTYMRYYNWAGGHENWGLGFRKLLVVSVMGIYGAGTCLLWRTWRNAQGRALLLLTALPTLAFFAGTGLYFRFLVPVLPLHTILLLWRIQDFPVLWRMARFGLVLLFALNGLLYLRSGTPGFREAWNVATGRLSRDDYLNHQFALMPLWTTINRSLPADARLMIIRYGGTYYCDRQCFVLNGYYQQRIRLDTWKHFLADTRREHIGYLIASPASEGKVMFGPPYLPARNENVFPQRLAHLYGQPIAAAADMRLYRLRIPQQ